MLDFIFKKFLGYIADRLKEPSTQGAAAAHLLAWANINWSADIKANIGQIIALVLSSLGMLMADKINSPTPQK